MTIHMDGKSLDLRSEQLERLKALFPEAISEGRIDFDRLRQTLGDQVIPLGERYVLNWAGKSEAFKAIQTPTTATLKAQKKESVDFDTTQNIFIEGENLEVLKVLQKSYYGKVKMIYIDPPYNTGNDSFIYPDKFAESKEEYLKRVGDKDEEGYLTKEGLFRKNSKENGQFHSNWLSMMYPRLFLARNLLRDDGVIFVSIDDNEVHNLRLMMNEIFGEENFVATFPWRKRTAKSDVPFRVSQDYEWILCYAKSELFTASIHGDGRKYFESPDLPNRPWRIHEMTTHRTATERPNSDFTITNPRTGQKYPVNPNAVWRVTKKSFVKFYSENKIVFPGDYEFLKISKPVLRYFKDEDESKAGEEFGFVAVSTNLPKEVGMTQDGTKDFSSLFENKAFGFPKPVDLIKHLIKFSTAIDKSGVVLDFFGGSGTTAQAVVELNRDDGGDRKSVIIQLTEKTETDSEAYKIGFKTIADICKERIRCVSKKMKKEIEKDADLVAEKKLDLGFKSFVLEPSNFKVWLTDTIKNEDDLKRQIEAFQDPVKKKSEAEAMAWEILIKSGYELTTPLERIEIADAPFYSIASGEVLLALEKVSQKAIDGIVGRPARQPGAESAGGDSSLDHPRPRRVICLDSLFAGNDQLKTNTVLQMKDAGVEFKTI